MKKSYIAPKNQVLEINSATTLMSASFTGDTGTVSVDDAGSYAGSDALSRENSSSVWDQGW